MGCHDHWNERDTEEERRNLEAEEKVLAALRTWIRKIGKKGKFTVEAVYDSQHAADPTFNVYTHEPTLSVRIGRDRP